MVDQLTAQEVSQFIWALYRPNGDCRSPRVMLKADGSVAGYVHPNESSWAPHPDGFAFLTRDGTVTSRTSRFSHNAGEGWRIEMVDAAQPDRVAHRLVQAGRRSVNDRSSGNAGEPQTPGAGDSEAMLNVDVPVPKAALQFLTPALKRVFFVANNADIPASAFASWNLGAEDILVQYNQPMHFAALAEYTCHKILFMSPNGDSCWGFTEDGQPCLDYERQNYESLTFALARWVPSRLKPYLDGLSGSNRYMGVFPSRHIGMFVYPNDRVPSVGFVAISFFRFLNWIRRSQMVHALKLTTIGFTGRYPKGGWQGHDFPFEQLAYETWNDLHRQGEDGNSGLAATIAAADL